jgi:hypothetical protein
MQINLEQEMLNFNKIPFVDQDGEALTLRSVLTEHVGMYRAESGSQAVKLWSLGSRISEALGAIEVDAADVALLKTALDRPVMAAVVVAQAINALAGPETEIVEDDTRIRRTRA